MKKFWQQPQFKPLFIFFIFPVVLNLLLLACFFSNNPFLQSLIVPKITLLNPQSWREFGLLENLENLYLLAMIVISFHGIKRKIPRWEKTLLFFVGLLAIIVFLEEIDYGLHYYEYWKQIPAAQSQTFRNFHNEGNHTENIRQLVDAFMLILFLVLPLLVKQNKINDSVHTSHFSIRYFVPNRWLMVTAIAMIALSEFTHRIYDLGFGQGLLDKNVSEFRELTLYYIFLLYLGEWVYFR